MHKPLKVLIAYDGSPSADFAIEDLRSAGLGPRVQARIVTVVDSRISLSDAIVVNREFLGTGRYDRVLPDLAREVGKGERLASRAMKRISTRFPQWKIDSKTVVDAPASGILQEAEKWKADLIVLGARGHSGLERLLLGSVSEKVLSHARCGVRIARKPRYRHEGPARILVATDGSRAGRAMVRYVAGLDWPENTRFQVITALDYPLTQREATREERDRTLRVAEQALEILGRRGLVGTAILGEGDPRLAIPAAARKFRATGLFVGRRGLHGIRRWLLGGISSHLARHAPCTIEVIAS